MSDLLLKCSICQALIDDEDLFCANCGAEAPRPSPTVASDTALVSTHNFTCVGCGASMSYDASAQTLRCPFCGSERLSEERDAKALAPRRVVPFTVVREQASDILRGWLGKGFWRPGDLASAAEVAKMTAVFVPYWVFSARTFTYWTADTSQTPAGARGDWAPMSGEHRSNYTGLLIGASSALAPRETEAICPFDLAAAVPPEQVDLNNIVVEQFRVQRKYARPLAQQGMEQWEREACSQYVPGRCRNMQVNVRLHDLSSEPVLLPVWIMAYSYKGKLFRFLLNGQTGKATGQAPFSWAKLIMIIGIVIAVLMVLALCGGVASMLASH